MKEVTKERLKELLEGILADYRHKIHSDDVNKYTDELNDIIEKDRTISVEIVNDLITGIYDVNTNLGDEEKKDVLFNVVTSVNLKHLLDNNTEVTYTYNNDDENIKVADSKNIEGISTDSPSHTTIYELMEKYNINIFTIRIKNRIDPHFNYGLRGCPK